MKHGGMKDKSGSVIDLQTKSSGKTLVRSRTYKVMCDLTVCTVIADQKGSVSICLWPLYAKQYNLTCPVEMGIFQRKKTNTIGLEVACDVCISILLLPAM